MKKNYQASVYEGVFLSRHDQTRIAPEAFPELRNWNIFALYLRKPQQFWVQSLLVEVMSVMSRMSDI
jgi:hypothetical protein